MKILNGTIENEHWTELFHCDWTRPATLTYILAVVGLNLSLSLQTVDKKWS